MRLRSEFTMPPRHANIKPPFSCEPVVLPPARRGALIFLLSRSELSRLVVALPHYVDAAEFSLHLIPCAYPAKLQSALRILVCECRLCKFVSVDCVRWRRL